MHGRGVIFNEQLNDNILYIKSLKNSCALTDGVSETLKHELKRQEGIFFVLLTTLGASWFEKRQEGEFFPILLLSLISFLIGKEDKDLHYGFLH